VNWRRPHLTGAILLMLAATFSPPALEAPAAGRAMSTAPLGCGDTVAADTTLHADLVDCPSNGLVIGADDITLDLNGYTIDGNEALVNTCPETEICDIGVLNDGHHRVRIKDGEISQFGVGALVLDARRNGLSDLTTTRNVFSGIILAQSSRSSVRWSQTFGNAGPGSGVGITLFRSHENRIRHNRVYRNAELGIHLDTSNRNYVANNVVRHNPEDGIILQGNRNVIAANRVVRNSITVTLFSRNAEAVGNVVRGNRVSRAPRGGVAIDPESQRTVVRRNHVFRAGLHGILVGNPSTKVTRNEARDNRRLGIKAVRGTFDGGGNRASGNGDPRQCLNIACSR
jgi:parallel beta-helix repeat protein